MTATLPPARVDAVSPDFCVARWENFYVVIWRVNTTMTGLEAFAGGFLDFVKGFPDGVGLVTIVEAGAPLPAADVRQATAELLAEAAPHVRCSAVVFEGIGFRAAAVRGIVTSISMLARPPYPHRIFSTVTEASSWIHRTFGGASGPQLEAAIDELRRRIGRRG